MWFLGPFCHRIKEKSGRIYLSLLKLYTYKLLATFSSLDVAKYNFSVSNFSCHLVSTVLLNLKETPLGSCLVQNCTFSSPAQQDHLPYNLLQEDGKMSLHSSLSNAWNDGWQNVKIRAKNKPSNQNHPKTLLNKSETNVNLLGIVFIKTIFRKVT